MVKKDYQVSKIGPEILEFPVSKISRGISRDFTTGQDYEKIRTGNYRKQLKLTWYTVDNDQAKRLREMFTNPTFNPLYLSGIGLHDGLYAVKSAGSKRTGVPNLEEWSAQFEDAGQKLMLSWNEEELVTDWDTYIDTPFTAGTWSDNDIASTTSETDEDGMIWYADNGNWNIGTSTMICDGDLGTNFISTGYLWYEDVDVSCKVKTTDNAGIILRFQNTTNYYRFLIKPSINFVSFYRGGAELRRWSKTMGTTTYYTLRAKITGDRVTLWVDGEIYTEDEPLIDNLCFAGKVGLTANALGSDFDDFTCKIAKETHLTVPPGALELNRYYEARQVSSHGLNKLLVSPRQPITYDERSIFEYDPDCVLSLMFNEGDGSILYDHVYGNHGSISGAIWSSEGYNEYTPMSLKFDGVDDTVVITDDNSLDFEANFTVECVVRLNDDPGDSGFLAKRSGGNGFRMDYWSSKLRFLIDTSGGGVAAAIANVNASQNTWYHLIGIADGGTAYLYIDGILQTTTALSGPGSVTNAINLELGRMELNNTYACKCNIALARIITGAKDATWVQQRYDQLTLNRTCQNEVRVWGVPKNSLADGYWEDTVLHLRMNEGAGTATRDSSKNGLTVTCTNLVDADWEDSVHPSFGKCIDFDDATNTLVYVNNASELKIFDNDWTAYIWFNTTDTTTRGLWIASDAYATINDYINILIDDGNTKMTITYNGSTGSNTWDCSPTSAYNDGNYHLAVITFDSSEGSYGQFEFYIDGSSLGTHDLTNIGNFNTIDSIQVMGYGLNIMDGKADEFRLLKRKLSSTEIAWLYNHAPRIMKEEDWVRVPDISHPFEDQWLCVENGQLRYISWGSGTYADRDDWQYWNGFWETAFYFHMGSESITAYRLSPPVLTKLTRDYVEWTVEKDHDTYARFTDRYRMYSGLPLIRISQELFRQENWSNENLTYSYLYHLGSEYLAGRYTVSTDTTMANAIGDRALGDTNTINPDSDNFVITFSPERNYLAVMVGMDDYLSVDYPNVTLHASYSQIYGQLSEWDYTPLNYGVALIPFDTSWLNSYITRNAPHSWSNGSGENNWCATYGNTEYVNIGITTSKVVTFTEKGSYRVFIHWGSLSGIGDGRFYTTGALTNGDTGTVTNITAKGSCAGQWNYIDLIADEEDAITLVMNGIADEAIYGGQVVIVPISLANFQGPLNIAHAALNPVTLTRQGT